LFASKPTRKAIFHCSSTPFQRAKRDLTKQKSIRKKILLDHPTFYQKYTS
jgi:hypothetical protein